jgi:hypothetical protein
LECDAPGQKLIWLFTQQLWTLKYDRWPDLNWGLILGSDLVNEFDEAFVGAMNNVKREGLDVSVEHGYGNERVLLVTLSFSSQ